MKVRLFTVGLLLILFPAWAFSKRVYVNPAATSGLNNGTSWANAYTSLELYLIYESKPADTVWVVSGTYRPYFATSMKFGFELISGIKIFGGFMGTETKFEQRDPQKNVTILSADVNGDDIPNNFTANKSDNTHHVIRVYPDSAGVNVTVIDGFTIQNGNTFDSTPGLYFSEHGGGIVSISRVEIRNCNISSNAGFWGAGISLTGPKSSGSKLINCIIENNVTKKDGWAAGVYFQNSTGNEMINCIIRGNTTNQGAVFVESCTDITIDSCQFLNNNGIPYEGGGLTAYATTIWVKNSIFKDNTAPYGAGIFFAGLGNFTKLFKVENCLFENNKTTANTASSYGGSGICSRAYWGEINRCKFVNNYAVKGGGAVYLDGNDATETEMTVKNCEFEGNTAYGGAAIAVLQELTTMFVDSCTFKNNIASEVGGAIYNGIQAMVNVKNSSFLLNKAKAAGAICQYDDNTSMTVNGCLFKQNSASEAGGAMFTISSVKWEVKNSIFEENSSSKYGGGIYLQEANLNVGKLTMSNVIMRNNKAGVIASAIFAQNNDVILTNALFEGNNATGISAFGGTVFNIATGTKKANLTATNCTFAQNLAANSAGILQQEDASAQAKTTLQNTIFQNSGKNYAALGGTPDVTSKGGNISSDATFASVFTAINDLNNTDPQFEDPQGRNFQLKLTSPGIDKGILEGAPLLDLLGKPRINAPDIGCFENQDMTSGTEYLSQPELALHVSPNPATDFIQIEFDNEFSGAAVLDFYAVSGQLLKSLHFDKVAGLSMHTFDIASLPAGAYLARVRFGELVASGVILKN